MENSQITEAINGLNATIRRLIFAYECDRGLELGRNGYYKKDEARDVYELMSEAASTGARGLKQAQWILEDQAEQESQYLSSISKAERKAFFQKQLELLEQEGDK